ncbi:hypothetical protein WDW37_11490 [Bdellovibrionota bacterium FG-1]
MIQIPKPQMDQVEYLIEQSLRGNHILFETRDLRRIFRGHGRQSNLLTEAEAYAAEPIIEKLIQEPTIAQKRALLDQLDKRTFDTVVRTYFCIVENNLVGRIEEKH